MSLIFIARLVCLLIIVLGYTVANTVFMRTSSSWWMDDVMKTVMMEHSFENVTFPCPGNVLDPNFLYFCRKCTKNH